MHQRPARAQRLDDRLLGLAHVQARHQRRAGDEHAVRTHRVVHRQAVLLADHVVVHTVRRRGVHQAGAGIQGHMLAKDQWHIAVGERMLRLDALQRRALGASQHLRLGAIALARGLEQTLGQHQALLAELRQHVLQLRMRADRLVRRQGPRGGGPDHQPGRLGTGQAKTAIEVRGIGRHEAHVDRQRLLVLILHLGLGQGGAAVQAPVHRLETAHHMAVLDDARQYAQLLSLERRIHRQVRAIPIRQHAETAEVGALPFHLLHRILATLGAELGGIELHAHLAVLLFHLLLDRQAMAIPAGHERGIVAVQARGLHYDVLQRLVDGMADMDIAIRIRRPVDEPVLLAPPACRLHLVVQALGLPARQHLRLALRQVRLHRERRLRQVEGLLVVDHRVLLVDFVRHVTIRQEPLIRSTARPVVATPSKNAFACAPSACICAASASSESNFSCGRR